MTTLLDATSPASPAAPVIPAVASLALRSVVVGPPRPVRELARFSQALYLAVDVSPPATSSDEPVIALLAPGAVAVPGALQLTTVLDRWPAAAAVGTVGDGRLVIDGHVVVVHRWWDPVPHLTSTTTDALRRRASRVASCLDGTPNGVADPGLSRPFAQVLAALSSGDDEAAASAADAMLGLGPGLTPSGDDLLAGLLASLPPLQASIAPACGAVAPDPGGGLDVAPGADERLTAAARRLGATVADRAEGRTTTVSAELLRHAATGAVARPVLQLLRALTGQGAIDHAVAELLAVGSDSGRDLTRGVLAAVALLTGDSTLHPITRSLLRGP